MRVRAVDRRMQREWNEAVEAAFELVDWPFMVDVLDEWHQVPVQFSPSVMRRLRPGWRSAKLT